ncbi:small ribosomal subunit protein mS78 (rPPR3a)-like [Cornus florida]|uniref:small ribosomal subunit protein mS78 (rPPR3a)-like n=1 Tax=Cornus florida TaxID=4283 RepID=UPI0028A14088|nr:small ribosomal subunit protein mS78 (rPPR3a)-like [Cornus florida]
MSSSVYRRLNGLFPATTSTSSLPKTPKTKNPLPKTPKTKNLLDIVENFKKSSDSEHFRNRASSYKATVRRLFNAGKLSYIEDILEHQKRYKNITNERFTVRIMSLYGKYGMFEHAHKLFDEMPHLKCDRTVVSFNALLGAYVNSKNFDKIGQLFRELPEKLSIQPDTVSYNTVVKAFCQMGSFDAARSVIEEMEKNGIGPDLITFNTLLDAFCRNNRISDTEKVLAQMEEKNVVPNARSYNPKLRGLVADNRISEAVEVFEEMRRKGVKPDIYSFNALIKGFWVSKNLEEAKRWYCEIAKNDCAPDRATITMLLFLACDEGDFDFALELCKEAFHQRFLVKSAKLQCVVDGLAKESEKKKKKLDEAKELLELGKSNYKLKVPADTKEQSYSFSVLV